MSDEKKPISVSEAIWRTGGGSGEFRYRLGVRLGHIKPDQDKCTCPYWWDFEINEGQHHANCGRRAGRQG